MTEEDPARQQRRLGKGMYYAFWLIVLAFATWAFGDYLESRNNPNQALQSQVTTDGAREVVLQRNRAGHFVASGQINGQPVTFLLDTGASDVSVPGHVADRLGLERQARITYRTANGDAVGFLTELDSVGLGGVVAHDVRGSINPNVDFDQVLLGMSFLRRLELDQRGDKLILRRSPS